MPKFRVTGSNRETSARMTLELTAASKGDAERKAAQAGMIVSHVTPINDSNTAEETKHAMAKNYRQEESGSNQKKLIIIFLILLVIFVFTGLVWPGFWR